MKALTRAENLAKIQEEQMRRRSKQEFKKQTTLQPAFEELKKLRTRMIKHMVTVDFTVEDVIAWLWPKEILDILRTAYPYASEMWDSTARVCLSEPGVNINVTMDDILIPKPETVKIQYTDATPQIVDAIKQIKLIHNSFKEVEAVVNWLQEYASLSATRYYWPSVLSLLPANHEIHTCSSRYKEPLRVHTMIPAFRSTSTLIASALLCPPLPEDSTPPKVSLLINNELVPLL